MQIPILQVDGSINIWATQVDGIVSVPVLNVSGYLDTSVIYGTLSKTLKPITVSAYSGAFADNDLPVLTINASGSSDVVGTISIELPRLTVSANGYQNPYGSLDIAIPPLTITANGQGLPIASLNKTIPLITLTASGIPGELLSLDTSIPAIRLRSSSYWLSGGELGVSLPSLRISSHASGEKIALSLNMKNYGLTQYDNFDFNSICKFKGSVMGCKSNGIWLLEGTADDEDEIVWNIDFGKLDLANNMLRYLWLSGDIENEVTLIFTETAGEQNSYEYNQESINDGETEMRIKIGKNIRGKRSRYVTMELSGEGSAKIDRVHVFGESGKSR